MQTEYAYSFCDRMETAAARTSEWLNKSRYVYAGSYFCDLYFLAVEKTEWHALFSFVRKTGKSAVLVLPTPSQRNLERVKDRAGFLLTEYADVIVEIVVNDYAMLLWAGSLQPKVDIWCGRLMSKEIRDPRYPELVQSGKLAEHLINESLFGITVAGLEMEQPFSAGASIRTAVHVPFSYITMGRHCEISSIGSPVQEKFRLRDSCGRPCKRFWMRYENDQADFLKYGRAVYAKCSNPEGSLQRVIYNGIADMI